MSLHDASRADLNDAAPSSSSPPSPPPAAIACAQHRFVPDLERGSPWLRCKRCGASERAELRGNLAKRFAPDGIEHRFTTLKDVAVDPETRTFEGYAVVWGVKNGHKEIFEQGAFARTLGEWAAEGELPSFYLQHNWDLLIGEWTEMREDEKGLFVRGRFIRSAWGDHGLALVREKIATGLSIGFIHNDYTVENEQDWPNRTIRVHEVTLFEVSLVERASDPAAGVTAIRSIRPDMTVREIEQILGAIPGMPKGAAKAMAASWKPRPRIDGRDVHDSETIPAPEGETRDASDEEIAALILGACETLKP